MAKFGIGQSARRLEDPRLLTGGGRYTDDTRLSAPAARAYVLRSPHAHADIRSIDINAERFAVIRLGEGRSGLDQYFESCESILLSLAPNKSSLLGTFREQVCEWC